MSLKGLSTLLTLLYTTQALSFEYKPVSECTQVLDYAYYSLCYSAEHQQAEWTLHHLTKESIRGNQKRTDDFRSDRQASPVVSSKAYRGSGFDRGHLVPAADMKLNREAMSETFYMTNMSPQTPSFNRGIWRSLEYGFRKAVLSFGSAYIVTAPLFTKGMRRIHEGVSVPDYFYKIAYFPEANFMMAYILPNKNLKGERYTEYSVSVDTIEELSGIDFFSDLPDEIEEALEENIQ